MLQHNLSRRSMESEWMDEVSIQDERLTDALAELRVINRWLGGYDTSLSVIAPLLMRLPKGAPFSILDIGCGGGDFVGFLAKWIAKYAPDVVLSITAIDNSPATIDWARQNLRKELTEAQFCGVTLLCGDAFDLPFHAHSFDIVHASLFLHHFTSDDVVKLMRGMERSSKRGIVVNDLHRHPIALAAISLLANAFYASAMVRHDGPLSVRRSFTRAELTRIASAANLTGAAISWRWAFRWLLTTVRN